MRRRWWKNDVARQDRRRSRQTVADRVPLCWISDFDCTAFSNSSCAGPL